MTSDRRFKPNGLLLLGVAAAVAWVSAGTATAQDKTAPTNQDAKAQKAENDAAGAKPGTIQTKRVSQPPKTVSGQNQSGSQKPGIAQKSGGAPPSPTVVLKPGEVPDVKFDTPTYDFGRIRAGQPVLHDFWFTNTGTGPLEIVRVKPS
jgi:hypothetical protein